MSLNETTIGRSNELPAIAKLNIVIIFIFKLARTNGGKHLKYWSSKHFRIQL